MGVCFSGGGGGGGVEGLIEMGNSAGSLKNHIATAEKTGALNFTEKKLDEFPTALAKTANTLRSLDLSKNRIPSVPGGVIGTFKMLKTLKIDENRLTILPPEIGNLASSLAVDGCNILFGYDLVRLMK